MNDEKVVEEFFSILDKNFNANLSNNDKNSINRYIENIKLKNKLVNNLAVLLTTDIIPSDIDLLNCNLIEPVKLLHLNGIDINERLQIPRDDYRKIIADYISQKLAHFKANPSIKENITDLNDIYTFNDDTNNKSYEYFQINNVADIFINASPKTVNTFVNDIATISQFNRLLYLMHKKSINNTPIFSRDQNNISKIFFVGKKGTGKTTLINYAFTIYNKLLEDSKVIWIRIDLTKDSRFNITYRMRYQFCKILFDYYDSNKITQKKLTFNLSHTNNFLKKRIEQYNITFKDNNEKYIDFFSECKILSTEPYQVEKIPNVFYYGLFDYLVMDCNISFIFIIDGLDKLDLTEIRKNQFINWIEEIKYTIMPRYVIPAIFFNSA